MRRICKYKNYSKSRLLLKRFPTRLFKFKKTKWKRVQVLCKRSTLFSSKKGLSRFRIKQGVKKTTVFNISKIRLKQNRWSRVKNAFRNFLEKKRFFYNFFDGNKFPGDSFFYKKRDFMLYNLIQKSFTLHILLWNVFFFNSTFKAKQVSQSGFILVNNKVVKNSVVLRSGDVITVLDLKKENFSFKNVCLSFSKTKTLVGYIEVDLYTKNLIVIKDIKTLGVEDFYILIKDYIDLRG